MISRKDFFDNKLPKINTGKKPDNSVENFLKKNKGTAYEIKEISKALKITQDSVRGKIKLLIQNKKVLHKKPCFIWK
jgi:hypothetical protein